MNQNLLFITADQWRGECLSTLGHQVQTPHLDQLAREGILFRRHYANAAPCGPSRASLHTGLYLQNHRSATNGTPLDARHTNWALEMRKAGMDPVLFGYTDTSADPRGLENDDPTLTTYQGVLPGLREIVKMGDFPDPWADWLAAKGYEIPQPNWKLYTSKRAQPEWEDGGEFPAPLSIPAEHHDTAFMVNQTIDYTRKTQQNWCIHLSLLRPHPPWIAPEPFNTLYDPANLPGFTRASTLASESTQHPFLDYMLHAPRSAAPADEKKLRRMKASYYGLMTEVDTNLGRLFDHLKATGQWDKTLIIFTSDHGEQMGDHWLLGKMGYFDQSYHIPLIIRDPELTAKQGATVSGFTENVDLMPTILERFKLPVPIQCDGRSLVPLLKNESPPSDWRKEVHWEFDFRDVVEGRPELQLGIGLHQCVLNVLRNDRYKYVHFSALQPILFDLENDPGEMYNLADDKHYRDILLAMTRQMLSWRMDHDERGLTHLALTENGVFSRTY